MTTFTLPGYTPAVEFDATTGTIIKVLEDAPTLTYPEDWQGGRMYFAMYLPDEVDGVTVEYIAPYALEGLDGVVELFLPEFVLEITAPVAKDCENLWQIGRMGNSTWIKSDLVENCPRYNASETAYPGFGNIEDVPVDFFASTGLLQGTGKSYNLTGTLTRAEAVTLLIRLAGLEESALAGEAPASPFTDVPDWATPYVDMAYAVGMTTGTSATTFSPDALCEAQDFITLLYRLTDLVEGEDYSWGTAKEDYVSDLQSFMDTGLFLMSGLNSSTGLTGLNSYADDLSFYLYDDSPMNRHLAVHIAFYMLSFPAWISGNMYLDGAFIEGDFWLAWLNPDLDSWVSRELDSYR